MTRDPIIQSRQTFGFLSPFGDHRIGAVGDLAGFFALAKRVDAPLPVVHTELYPGYVGADQIAALEVEVAVLSAGLAAMRMTPGALAALGFTPNYLEQCLNQTPAGVCAKPLAALTRCIEEARSEREVFPDNPNHAIRTGSTAIPDSMFMRDLPREAFFREGGPIWLNDRPAASQSSDILQ